MAELVQHAIGLNAVMFADLTTMALAWGFIPINQSPVELLNFRKNCGIVT